MGHDRDFGSIVPPAVDWAKVNERLAEVVREFDAARWGSVPPADEQPKQLDRSIESVAAVRRMDAYLKDRGIGLRELAARAGTSDRTLRNFRRTGRIRRDLAVDIARAMRLDLDQLLAPLDE